MLCRFTDESSKCALKIISKKQIIILHPEEFDRCVQNKLFISAKNIKHCNADHYKDMSAKLFKEWFEKQRMPNTSNKNVIVRDNALSHLRHLIKRCLTQTRKQNIINVLY